MLKCWLNDGYDWSWLVIKNGSQEMIKLETNNKQQEWLIVGILPGIAGFVTYGMDAKHLRFGYGSGGVPEPCVVNPSRQLDYGHTKTGYRVALDSRPNYEFMKMIQASLHRHVHTRKRRTDLVGNLYMLGARGGSK